MASRSLQQNAPCSLRDGSVMAALRTKVPTVSLCRRSGTHWSCHSLLEADALDFLLAVRQLLAQVRVSGIDLRCSLVVRQRLLHPAHAHVGICSPVDALPHQASQSDTAQTMHLDCTIARASPADIIAAGQAGPALHANCEIRNMYAHAKAPERQAIVWQRPVTRQHMFQDMGVL